MTRDALLAEILKLPLKEQVELVDALEELVPVRGQDSDDPPLLAWHKEELDRCLDDTDPSNVANLSWKEVRESMNDILRRPKK